MEGRLDTNTTNNVVDLISILIDPNTFNSDVYVMDNIEIAGTGGNTGNQNPVASFITTCTELSCTFDCSASSDSDGSIVSYQWNFADGNNGAGAVTNHVYANDGSYAVTLTVEDDQAASDSASEPVVVSTGGTSEARATVVSSVVTGTAGAGRGKKFGTASVTVVNDIGAPAEGGTVSGNFTGTWNESGSAVTDSNGIAEFTSSSSSSGVVTVNFCVSDVTGGLPLDTIASNGMCQ